MKTPDEIKNGLECCTSSANCNGCPYYCILHGSYGCEENGCDDSLLPDALAYIQQLESLVPRWIPVEERLPEEGVDVVIRYGKDGFCEVASRSGENWHCAEYVVLGGEWITHWMALPEPPEEVQHD